MSEYLTVTKTLSWPRLPLEGAIDLTYRCNNACRHCWTRLPLDAPEKQRELSFDEIRRVAHEARGLGCRKWSISGGEPMVRHDFAEIFDYLTGRSAGYSLNTNGTLITPEIAQLMKRKGDKMVALYGATADVYDHVTRRPGGFEQAMQGIAYLKEAGAGFTVQLIPVRDNRRQWDAMVALAESLSPRWRAGASWLYLSDCGAPARDAEIAAQRLDPHDVVALDPPDLSHEERMAEMEAGAGPPGGCAPARQGDDRLFAGCIERRRDFHVDAYGGMSFCCFIKDSELRYDLRRGTVREAWEEFIPSLAGRVRGDREYFANCGACARRSDCRWCPAYGFLEHRRYSAPVTYLCAVTHECLNFKEDRQRRHRRHFQVAGISVRVESDLPITDTTFTPALEKFHVDRPGEDLITIRHHFGLPDLDGQDLGVEIFRNPPWAIYRKGDSWIYRGIYSDGAQERPHQVAVFNRDHTHARIYNPNAEIFERGKLHSLTLFPTDQILLARLLSDRGGCFLHASGVILNGEGLVFVGHSEAGKSTTVKLLDGRAEILCDDRIIVRRWPDGFKIHGCWSHGEVPKVSSASAPLGAILFLKKSADNQITPLDDRKLIVQRLLACLVKPLVTADWWEKSLDVIEILAREARCYEMEFDKSGAIVPLLEDLTTKCTKY